MFINDKVFFIVVAWFMDEDSQNCICVKATIL